MANKFKHKPMRTRMKSMSRIICLLVVILGAAVLFGWALDIPALKSLNPAWVSMKANSAICFVLTAMALVLLTGTQKPRYLKYAAFLCIVVTFTIAGLTLLQYSFGFDSRLDEFFFRDDTDPVATSHPGRMSPLSAINFMLVSGSLFFIALPAKKYFPFQLLNLASGLFSLVSLLGYLFGADELLTISRGTNISFQTAVFFLLLNLAALFTYPEESILKLVSSDTIGGELFRKTLPFVFFATVLLGWLRLQGELAGFYDIRLGVAIFVLSVMIVFTVTLYHNASALSKSEATLKQFEMHLNSTYECLPNGLLLIDNKFEVIQFNRLFQHFALKCWGVNIYEGQNFVNLLPPRRRDVFAVNYRKMLAGEKVAYEVPIVTAEGEYLLFSIAFHAVTNRQEDIVGCFFACEDITLQRKREEEAAAEKLQLGERVEQSHYQYVQVNTELDSFTYSVSHDLRAPLRAVTSYAQILVEDYQDKLDADGKQVLQKIRYNTDKMGKLIDELLAFSKLGRKQLNMQPVNMAKLTETVIADLAELMPNKATFVVGTLPDVSGDSGLLYQVMFNLVSNAIKYSSNKSNPWIDIGSEVQDSKVVYFVKDNGAGFDMRFADKLFGVFQRLHGENEFEGHGIGLSIVHKIITKHGGEVWGEGQVNAGASFYFRLN